MTTETEFTAEKDHIGTLPDGRQYQILGKGVTVSMAEAKRLGLVKDKAKETAAEKAEAAAENKAEIPLKNKGKKAKV